MVNSIDAWTNEQIDLAITLWNERKHGRAMAYCIDDREVCAGVLLELCEHDPEQAQEFIRLLFSTCEIDFKERQVW